MANAVRPIVGVRVGVKNGGCAGMAYTMEYAQKVEPSDESGSVFRARTGGRAGTAGKVLGTARGDEHGAAVARSGQAARGPRASRSGLRLVHRRLRHARDLKEAKALLGELASGEAQRNLRLN